MIAVAPEDLHRSRRRIGDDSRLWYDEAGSCPDPDCRVAIGSRSWTLSEIASGSCVNLVFGSRGDFNEMSSDGWSNDRLIWSQLDNGRVVYRETLTRRDQNDYTDEVETMIGGNLTTLGTAHCTRQPTESV